MTVFTCNVRRGTFYVLVSEKREVKRVLDILCNFMSSAEHE